MTDVKDYLKLSPYFERVNWDKIDLPMLIEKTLEEMPDQYDQVLFYERLANRAGSFSNSCTEYDSLASLIFSKLHDEKTASSFVEVVSSLQENKDVMGRDRPILSNEFVEMIYKHSDQVEDLFKKYCDDCFLPSMFGWKTLLRSYLLKSNGIIRERLPHMLFRVALFIHGTEWEKVEQCYRDLLAGKYTHATPTLFHAGTRRSQMASCFLPDTKVWTSKGSKPISQVEIGDLVFTHQGRLQKVVQLHKNQRYNRKLFELYTSYKKVAIATEDHEFMVFDSVKGATEWKPLSKLKNTDYLQQMYHTPQMFPSSNNVPVMSKFVKKFLYTFPRLTGSLLGQIYQSRQEVSNEIRISFGLRNQCLKMHESLKAQEYKSRVEDKELILVDPTLIYQFHSNRLDVLRWLIHDGLTDVYFGFLEVMIQRRWETFSKEEADLLCILLNKLSEEEWGIQNHIVYAMEPIISPSCGICYDKRPPKITIDGKRFVRFFKRIRVKEEEAKHSEVYTLGVENDHSYCVEGVIAKNCFLLGTEDSVDGIFKTIADCAQISKWAGGIGVHMSNIRANKSYIYGTNGNSNGILPMLKVYNDVSRYIDQCFTPDVLLFTKKGMVPIGNIQPGDKVLSAQGQFQSVKKVVLHDWDGKVWNMEGKRTTAEHNFLIRSPDGKHTDYQTLEETSNAESILFPKISFYNEYVDQNFTNAHLQVLFHILNQRWKWEELKENEFQYKMLIPPYDEELKNVFLRDFVFGAEIGEVEKNCLWVEKLAFKNWMHQNLSNIKKVSVEKQRLFLRNVLDVKEVKETVEMLKILTGWNLEDDKDMWKRSLSNISIKEEYYKGKVYDLEMEGDPSYVTAIGAVHNGGGKRNGAFAMYIEPWHADILDFINAKRNIGAEEERARDLFYGLWIPDLFMERVEKNMEWSLFCPSIAPGLSDVIGEDFRRLYESYEHQNRHSKKMPARELWSEILRAQIETGTPYMLYKDSCNFRSNQQNLGIIKSSNLCVSGDTRILTPRGLFPIAQKVNEEVQIWNGKDFVPVVVKQTGHQQELKQIEFSNGNYLVCTPYHKFYIEDNGKEKKVEAQELVKGVKIAPFQLPVSSKERYPHAFNWVNEKGIFLLDSIHLYSDDKDSLRECMLDLQGMGIVSILIEVGEDRYCLRLNRHSWKSMIEGNFKGDVVEDLFVENITSHSPGDTFCFQEPQTGKGWFDGIVTGQCTEIIEYSDHEEYACCNLASIALPRFLKPNPHKHKLQKAIVYTKSDCPFCKLLELEFPGLEKRKIEEHPEEWKEMKEQFQLKTVPAVFLEGNYLGGFQDIWASHLTPVFDFEELYRVVYSVTENLNKVIDLNIYPVPETERSNKKHRPIGIGIQGLADVFGQLRFAFDEEASRSLNREIFETIYFAALNASCDIAKKEGSYSSFQGSPLSKGFFHFELSAPVAPHKKPILSGRYDWEALRSRILTHGTRNSLLVAPMPTASTSQILGNTECFEPWTSNIFLRRTNAGEFYVCNSLLQRDLESLGMWNQETMDRLILTQGSIAQLNVPNFLKSIYRTVWEIPQKNLLEMAVDRQFFIDQSQSLNIFVTNPSLELLTKIHFYGWKNGLKTGCYYIRSRAPVSSINFAIDPSVQGGCEACSA